MYKTLGAKWLYKVLCPASAFATADSDEARNPQRFIHVTVTTHTKNPTRKWHIWFLPTHNPSQKTKRAIFFQRSTDK